MMLPLYIKDRVLKSVLSQETKWVLLEVDRGQMLKRPLRKFWINLLIAFNDNYTLEGFERTQKKFDLPDNFSLLDSRLKRNVTICNLFVNQRQTISSIARILDVDMSRVISTLIENGFIKERRGKAKRIKKEKRQMGWVPPMESSTGPAEKDSCTVKELNKGDLASALDLQEEKTLWCLVRELGVKENPKSPRLKQDLQRWDLIGQDKEQALNRNLDFPSRD